MNVQNIRCHCCGCSIQIEDDLDIRICEECTDCPKFQEGGPCLQNGELEEVKINKGVKMKNLKTITLGSGDEPILTLIKGRHSLKDFNRAFEREGWSEGDWDKELFGYGWFRKTKKGFKKSDINDLKAELYTFSEW